MTTKPIYHPNIPTNTRSNAKSIRLPIGIKLIIALVAGLGFSFALAPYYLWPLALFSVMALYALLVGEDSGRRGFWIGWVYGFGTWVIGAFWLYNSIHEYGAIPSWFAYMMIGVMAIIMGLFHAFLHGALCVSWVVNHWHLPRSG